MFVSVVICTWNRATLLDQTLEQMKHLRIPEDVDWELVVVNNNSIDDTPQILNKHATGLPLVSVFEPRPGLSIARNTGVATAKGELILITDDDVIADPGWLEGTVAAFQRHDSDFVYGKLDPWWESAPPKWFSAVFNGLFGLLDHGSVERVMPGPTYHGSGANHAFRREAIQSLGGYQTDLGLRHGSLGGGEEVDLFHRAYAAGMKVVYTPHATLRHFIPSTRNTKWYFRHREWHGSECHLKILRGEARKVPQLAGLPRYFLRRNVRFASEYLAGLVTGNASRTFFYELKLIRLVALLWLAFSSRSPVTP